MLLLNVIVVGFVGGVLLRLITIVIDDVVVDWRLLFLLVLSVGVDCCWLGCC